METPSADSSSIGLNQTEETTHHTQAASRSDHDIAASSAPIEPGEHRSRYSKTAPPALPLLEALSKLGSCVTTSSDTNLAFDTLATLFPPLLAIEHLLVYRCEDESLQSIAGELDADACADVEPRLFPLVEEVRTSGQPVALHGAEFAARQPGDIHEGKDVQFRSLLAAPLTMGEDCVGVVLACATAEGAFTDESIQAVVAAAHWLASAMRHEAQQQRLQRRLEELDTLATINRVISETVELEDVLQLIVESAGEIVCECDWAVLHLFDEQSGQLEPVVTFGLTLQPDEYRLAVEDGIAGSVFTNGSFINVHDLQKDERRLPFDVTIQSRAMLVAPLKNREECIGTLTVQCAKPGIYSEADERLLTTLGLQAFVAIQNAQLFQAEREAHHQAEMLRNITADLGRTLDPNAVFLTLRRSLNQVFDYHYALIMRLQEEGQRASLHVCCDTSSTPTSEHSIPEHSIPEHGIPEHGIPEHSTIEEAGRAVEQGEFKLDSQPELEQLIEERSVLVIDDIESDAQWGEQFWFVPGLRSWIAAPMVAQDQVMGLFWIARREAGSLSQDDEQILAESLASAAASALQNTSLYAEVQRASARLRRLNHMVLTAQEEERQRISRELHDESGQSLSALLISLNIANQELQRAVRALPRESAAASPAPLAHVQHRLEGAIATAESTMERIRGLTHNLRPPMLSTLGLNAAMEGLCQDVASQTGLAVRYEGAQLPPLPDIINITLYRILQEALANVAKHADAKSVAISLAFGDAQIKLAIADDGRGFALPLPVDTPGGGIGLLGMLERCEMLNGTLHVASQPGCGTTITATIPLEAAPATEQQCRLTE